MKFKYVKSVDMTDLERLLERRNKLAIQLADEEKADDRSQVYIDDLQSSINNIDSQIGHLRRDGTKYPVMNGN